MTPACTLLPKIDLEYNRTVHVAIHDTGHITLEIAAWPISLKVDAALTPSEALVIAAALATGIFLSTLLPYLSNLPR